MSEPIQDRLRNALADRYELHEELGAGGMATVYLADDLKHERKVAVKVLRPELAAVIGGERFITEIKTTAALPHPPSRLDFVDPDMLLAYTGNRVGGGRMLRNAAICAWIAGVRKTCRRTVFHCTSCGHLRT